MIFKETKLEGAYVVELKELRDDRGFFARSWCQKEFDEHSLNSQVAQANISFNENRGTLRGLHYQIAPFEETKLVRCTRGAIYDVIVDLRPESPTYRQWIAAELSAENHRMMFVPERFAHGYQTLEDQSEVFYQVSQFYAPGAERGARYDDPAFAIKWPIEIGAISEKDAGWAKFDV